MSPLVIGDLLRRASELHPGALALLAPDRLPMSYGRLWIHVQQVAGALHAEGIGHKDRVAVMLPDGPEMASSFLALSATAVVAPLNPVYGAKELEFFLSELSPRVLIVQAGRDSPAARVALSRGIRVIELVPQTDAEAGAFTLDGTPFAKADISPARSPRDVSLLLHTSGTTSRPKLVPLTQSNLCISARNIASSLRLTAADRCLSIMPMFHIHGLVGALLSSVAAGSSVVCTPGFHAVRFFDWFEEFLPTWYTAVPTMHRAILARAARRPRSRSHLRFVRSSSSPLPPTLMAEMEHAFQVPVVEAYGMTEASHQITVNPLPPGIRKAGSVGLPAGCEIAVLGADSAPLPPGEIGDIGIRGANVTHGYENNPKANESSFRGGWFLTGDQGRRDSAGYLFLTGRTKEIINRGGEKISPREVDEVLLEHPAVAEAITFPIPDQRLGEDVGAAVVLREGVSREGSLQFEAGLREYAAKQLAFFKVPRHIALVREIPKGLTGKPQRLGMAERLGLTEPTRNAAAAAQLPAPSELEMQLARIWEDLLETRPVGVREDFFEMGGDSILAVDMLLRIEAACGIRLPVSSLLPRATIENLASTLLKAQREENRSPIVPIQTQGTQPALFFHHGQWRGGGLYCSDLARHLGNDQPFFAIMPHGLDAKAVPRTIPAMAGERVQDLLKACPDGPIRLGGYCNGALVAFEMARRLQKLGRDVDLVVIVETHAPNVPYRRIWNLVRLTSYLIGLDDNAQADWFLRLRTLRTDWHRALRSGPGAVSALLLRKLGSIRTLIGRLAMATQNAARRATSDQTSKVYADPFDAINCYVPGAYKGAVALLRTSEIGSRTANFSAPDDPSAGWSQVAPRVRVYWLAGNHESIVRGQVEETARKLAQSLGDRGSPPDDPSNQAIAATALIRTPEPLPK